MSSVSNKLREALDIKLREIQRADEEYDAALVKAREEYPEIKVIEEKLRSIGANIALTALRGEKDKLKALKEESLSLCEKKKKLLMKAKVKPKKIICPLCNDENFVDGKVCRCVTDIAKELNFIEMSKRMPLDKCRFDNFDIDLYPEENRKKMQNIFKFCKAYAENFNDKSPNLLFIGPPGLGKTHLSLSIVNELIKKGVSVVYAPAADILGSIEAEHFSFSGETEAVDRVLNADLLLIDDLGTEMTSQFVLSAFYNIINTRINTSKPTVISTNLSFDELEKKYSPRITSRFIGEYEMKGFAGKDIRQIKKFGK